MKSVSLSFDLSYISEAGKILKGAPFEPARQEIFLPERMTVKTPQSPPSAVPAPLYAAVDAPASPERAEGFHPLRWNFF